MTGTNNFTRFLLILLFVALQSCEKIIRPPLQQSTPRELFEYLWNDIDQRYSYFEEKQIDWMAVKQQYDSLIHDDMDEFELFDVLGNMLWELQDGHVNLLSSFNRSRNWDWFEGYPLFYDEQLIFDEYLKTDYRIIGPLLVQTIDSMLYLNYRSFERSISEQHMNEIIRLLQTHKGLIIDLRNNGGGSLKNAYTMASRFIEQETKFAQQRFKSGPKHNDFTPFVNMQISAHNGERYLGKIAVLTNRKSYSATTFFAQMMKVLPQARLFGDQTGGGGGIPAYAELANGWTYRFSASQTIDLEGNHIEFGVLVDHLLTDPSLVIAGKDHFIEAAIEWLQQ